MEESLVKVTSKSFVGQKQERSVSHIPFSRPQVLFRSWPTSAVTVCRGGAGEEGPADRISSLPGPGKHGMC